MIDLKKALLSHIIHVMDCECFILDIYVVYCEILVFDVSRRKVLTLQYYDPSLPDYQYHCHCLGYVNKKESMQILLNISTRGIIVGYKDSDFESIKHEFGAFGSS